MSVLKTSACETTRAATGTLPASERSSETPQCIKLLLLTDVRTSNSLTGTPRVRQHTAVEEAAVLVSDVTHAGQAAALLLLR